MKNARLTGDQEVASSMPAGVGSVLSWVMGHSLPSADSRKAVVSFWRLKNDLYTRDVRNELLISIWRLQISS